MYAGHPPFSVASRSDEFFNRLVTNPAEFWKNVSKRHPEGFFTDDFKNLIENMLHEKPQRRLNLADIASHAFMTSNEVATKDEVTTELKRINLLNKEVD